MKKNRVTRMIALILLCSFLCTGSVFAETTQSDIDDAHSKVEDLQRQKEDAQNAADDIADEKAGLEGDLSGLNKQLSTVTGELNDLEEQIQEKEKEIEETDAKLAKAQEDSKKQYEDMKIRIQYMYENGNTTMLQMLLESESVSEFFNRTEYIKEINEYDRNMLETYNKLQEDIAAQKEELSSQKEELVAMQQEAQKKKENVSSLISSTQAKINEAAQDLQDAQSNVSDLEKQISDMEAYEEQLELQKAKEDAARLEAIKAQEQEDYSNVTVVPADGDFYLLGAIIQCEAEGESYEGKLAVGSVVINRVKSSYFPGTIAGVIYQSGQFSPVASGRLAYRLEAGVNAECLQAAQAVLDGQITLNCLYFRRNNGIIQGTVIGNHVFY